MTLRTFTQLLKRDGGMDRRVHQRSHDETSVQDAQRDAQWDAQCIARLKAGDVHVMQEIMDAHLHVVATLAFRYVRSRDEADDIANDTFIRLWDKRHTLRANVALRQFLLRLTRNRALALVRDAESIRSRSQDIFLLHFDGELTPDEIAAVLGVTVKLVHRELRSAVRTYGADVEVPIERVRDVPDGSDASDTPPTSDWDHRPTMQSVMTRVQRAALHLHVPHQAHAFGFAIPIFTLFQRRSRV